MEEEDEDFNIDSHEKLPIYKKAEEIYEVVSQIADLITDDPEDPFRLSKATCLVMPH